MVIEQVDNNSPLHMREGRIHGSSTFGPEIHDRIRHSTDAETRIERASDQLSKGPQVKHRR